MSDVITVLGSISPTQLGFTSMHEHILLDLRVWKYKNEHLIPVALLPLGDDPVRLDNVGLLKRNNFVVTDNKLLDDEAMMTEEVADFKRGGGDTILDLSSCGIRYDVEAVRRISQTTGVNVVIGTGFYIEDSWPDWAREMTVEQFEDLMVREIEVGIDETGIQAGHVGELGTGTLNEREVRLLKGGARAAVRTGVSLSIHQGAAVNGEDTLDILTGEGLAPDRIIMGHADRYFVEHSLPELVKTRAQSVNVDRALALLDRGANISIDCFGHTWDQELSDLVMTADWQRLAGLIALLEAGYTKQIVLGTDVCMKMLTRRGGGEGYSRLTNWVVPKLREFGVSDDDIQQITVHNPARLLAQV